MNLQNTARIFNSSNEEEKKKGKLSVITFNVSPEGKPSSYSSPRTNVNSIVRIMDTVRIVHFSPSFEISKRGLAKPIIFRAIYGTPIYTHIYKYNDYEI